VVVADPFSGDHQSTPAQVTPESSVRQVDVESVLAAAAAAVGGTPRVGQILMADAVLNAFTQGTHLLVQAGTGTGKSLAYVVPSMLRATTPGVGPVVIATATLALQRQLVEHDAPAIGPAIAHFLPRPAVVSVLKGRHNYLCRLRLSEREQKSAPGSSETGSSDTTPLFDDETVITGGRLSAQAKIVSRWATETESGDRDDLPEAIDARVWRAFSVSSAECVGRTRCPVGEDCFAEQARDAAREADVIVTNHAMLALDWIEGVPVLPEYSGVVIDEAHEWIDRATRAATLELSPAGITALGSAAGRLGVADDSDRLVQGAQDLAAATLVHVGQADHVRWKQLPEEIHDCAVVIREAARTTLSGLSHSGEARSTGGMDAQGTARQRLRAGLDAVINAIDRLLTADTDTVVWAQRAPERIMIAPLSIGDVLKARHDQPPVVLTSATLTSSAPVTRESSHSVDAVDPQFMEVARECGLSDQPWIGIDVGSPFDYARQGILYVARHLPEPGRDGIAEEALDEIAELVEAAGGRSLVLFSSWRAVERAGEYLRVRLDNEMRGTHPAARSSGGSAH
jgi:ATP-dependent DNA helicase DinG